MSIVKTITDNGLVSPRTSASFSTKMIINPTATGTLLISCPQKFWINGIIIGPGSRSYAVTLSQDLSDQPGIDSPIWGEIGTYNISNTQTTVTKLLSDLQLVFSRNIKLEITNNEATQQVFYCLNYAVLHTDCFIFRR